MNPLSLILYNICFVRDFYDFKQDEKLRARELKVKREKDLEIDKARQKLMAFKAELEGLQEDKDGAEADL